MITTNKPNLNQAELLDIINNIHRLQLPLQTHLRLLNEAVNKLSTTRMLRVAS